MILAGAALVDITPRTPCRLAGYAARDRPHDAVHDPLGLRALWLRGADGKDALIVSADILWFSASVAERIKALLDGELGVPPERAMLFGTHTHSAPDAGNPEWLHVVVAQAVAAAAIAKTRLRPAVIKLGGGSCAIGVNRREKTKDGKIILGRNPAGPCDRDLIVVSVDDADGYAVARLANFACHGVVMGQNSYAVSGDWPGAAAHAIERKMNEAPFLFLQGGSGNVNPRIGPQGDFAPVGELAAEFVRDFFTAEEQAEPQEEGDGKVVGQLLPVDFPAKPGGASPVKRAILHGLRVGNLRIAGFPGEVFSETTMAVKRTLSATPVLTCSYADGGDDGYVPVKEAYAEGGYEVDVSPYADSAEVLLRDSFLDVLGELGPG